MLFSHKELKIVKTKPEVYPPESSLHIKPYKKKGKLNKKCKVNLFPRKPDITRNE
jgi:hypothetical protein